MSLAKPKRVTSKEALDDVRGKPCLICRQPSVACHVKTRGAGGPDADWNLMPLCVLHHTIQGTMPILDFAEKFPMVAAYLNTFGWYEANNGKLWNDRLSKI